MPFSREEKEGEGGLTTLALEVGFIDRFVLRQERNLLLLAVQISLRRPLHRDQRGAFLLAVVGRRRSRHPGGGRGRRGGRRHLLPSTSTSSAHLLVKGEKCHSSISRGKFSLFFSLPHRFRYTSSSSPVDHGGVIGAVDAPSLPSPVGLLLLLAAPTSAGDLGKRGREHEIALHRAADPFTLCMKSSLKVSRNCLLMPQ